jgi:hypothetical protein
MASPPALTQLCSGLDSVDRKVSLFRDDLLVHLSGFERVKLKNLPGCII